MMWYYWYTMVWHTVMWYKNKLSVQYDVVWKSRVWDGVA